ncbi:MAG TPA: diacylglycerol kinase family protein [Rhizomicrobium sp.]|nr:diacylglycerol kinase family protein [Rhizomicrobium sp.]
MTAFVVFNPGADGGRTGRDWQQIETALEQVFPLLSFFVTTGPTQAARVVRDALRDGHMEIVAVGGEGTINEALNGFFDHGAMVSPEAVFSFVHSGSPGVLSRRFNLTPGWQAGVARLKKARAHKIDIGHVACLGPGGVPVTRFFLGGASFGLSASIARRMGAARIARFFGPKFAQWFHARMALWRWRETRIRLMADGYDEIAGIASVRLAPQSGLFDMAVTDGSAATSIAKKTVDESRRLRSGHVTAAPTLDTHGPVEVETDGESAGILPATFDIYPGAINLRV